MWGGIASTSKVHRLTRRRKRTGKQGGGGDALGQTISITSRLYCRHRRGPKEFRGHGRLVSGTKGGKNRGRLSEFCRSGFEHVVAYVFAFVNPKRVGGETREGEKMY